MIGILDVLGPVMIGPSSSHTAGALKLARTAALIAGQSFNRVVFELHGSFADTGTGHGTDRALLAGVLGYSETDDAIASVFDSAAARGVAYEFRKIELPDAHENSCVITFYEDDAVVARVTGSSIGGGQIAVTAIDGFPCELSAQSPTLVLRQYDRRGVIGAVTSLLADAGINIALMRVGREKRGDIATTVIETDGVIPPETLEKLRTLNNIISVRFICP